ncbi:MAG: TetR/AcrR family transcriptional regulator [Pseudomonadota bacterium]
MSAASTVKPGRKIEQAIDGARQIFLRDGYEGASMEEVSRAAQVSKATLYSYFSDKRHLFMEVAKRECQRQADMAIARMAMDGPVAEVMFEAASTMVRFFISDLGRETYRIAVAESARFPELGREFYESGPTIARLALTRYLENRIAVGELNIDDVELAADQFIELCKASIHTKMMMGIKTHFSDDEIDRVIRGAVEMFIARYGAP